MRCFGWFYEMRGWFREGVEQVEFVVEPLQGGSDEEARRIAI
jgi:hypothetical protein